MQQNDFIRIIENQCNLQIFTTLQAKELSTCQCRMKSDEVCRGSSMKLIGLPRLVASCVNYYTLVFSSLHFAFNTLHLVRDAILILTLVKGR